MFLSVKTFYHPEFGGCECAALSLQPGAMSSVTALLCSPVQTLNAIIQELGNKGAPSFPCWSWNPDNN